MVTCPEDERKQLQAGDTWPILPTNNIWGAGRGICVKVKKSQEFSEWVALRFFE